MCIPNLELSDVAVTPVNQSAICCRVACAFIHTHIHGFGMSGQPVGAAKLRDGDSIESGELPSLARLRPREWEVLNLLATGATNAEMAKRLQVAEGTIRNVVARLTVKLRVADRTQAALLALQEGLGEPDV
jgi:DNA-binding NarL/FixJ family response regulator